MENRELSKNFHLLGNVQQIPRLGSRAHAAEPVEREWAQNDSAMEGDGGETGAIISPRDSPIPWVAAAATQLSTPMASGYGSRVWLVFIK